MIRTADLKLCPTDLDDDNQISAKDICGIIDRLTVVSNKDTGRIEFPLKKKIAHVVSTYLCTIYLLQKTSKQVILHKFSVIDGT